MIWFFVIIVIGFVLFKFFNSLNKDNDELKSQTLENKFGVIVNMINKESFGGTGSVISIDKREFNLYKEGSNEIIKFHYSSGHLTITWRYKYFQKEVVHERTFNDVRNLSLFEQQKIGEGIIKEMNSIVEKHKNEVSGLTKEPKINKEVIKTNSNPLLEPENEFLRDFLTLNSNSSIESDNETQYKYFDNGVLKNKGKFKISKHDKLFVDDMINERKDGYWEYYYDNEKLKKCGHYINGHEVETWLHYYRNGKLKSKNLYKDNNPHLYDNWWEFKELHFYKSEYTKESYYKNGKLKGINNYHNDEEDGIQRTYYKNGQLKIKIDIGFMNDDYEEYFENGQLKIKTSYDLEELDGDYEEYFENGQLKLKTYYRYGDIDGEYNEYDLNGNLLKHLNYERGKLVM